MTKQDYMLIAQAIQEARKWTSVPHAGVTDKSINVVALHIANACGVENPLFKRSKFLGACGVPVSGGVRKS